MNFNKVATGLSFIGATVREMKLDNDIFILDKEAKRSLGLNIHEPKITKQDKSFLGQLLIDFTVEIEQEESKCKIELSIEGLFDSAEDMPEDELKKLVALNGAAALIGIARGRIEGITANAFSDGKVTLPLINVYDYYKGVMEAKKEK
jgi:hypothetical protein